MNFVSEGSQRIDAATQTDMAELSPSHSRAGFQGYEVDCEKGRSIVVNCSENNQVSFVPQPNCGRVVINVEPIIDQGSAATRSYTVNLSPPASSRLSDSDAGSTLSSFDSISRDFDISLPSSYPGRPQLEPLLDVSATDQSRSVAGMPGTRVSVLFDGEATPRERLSVDSTESSERPSSCPLCCFLNGKLIRDIATQIDNALQAKKPVSELILHKLNVYNPTCPPKWYREQYKLRSSWLWRTSLERINNCGASFGFVTSFMVNSFAKWAGWADEAGKCKKVIAESEACLDARFVLFLENDTNAFERLAEVSQTIICVERDMCEFFKGELKGDGIITIYETLSFRSVNGKKREEFNQVVSKNSERYRAHCDAGVVFFFRELCKMIKEVEAFDKYQSKRKEILAKYARLGLLHMDQLSNKIPLLVACINYNLAVYLIEKEYRQAGLPEFDTARRVGGRLSVSTDYDRFTNEDLGIIQDFLKLIDALEQEVQELLSIYEAEINGLPRLNKGCQSFEQRVLHLSSNGSGYVSKPLGGIRATLLNILDNRPARGTEA